MKSREERVLPRPAEHVSSLASVGVRSSLRVPETKGELSSMSRGCPAADLSPSDLRPSPVLPSRAQQNLASSTTGQVFRSPLFYFLSVLPGMPLPTSMFLSAYFSMLGMMSLYSLMNAEEGGSSSCLGWTVKYRMENTQRELPSPQAPLLPLTPRICGKYLGSQLG